MLVIDNDDRRIRLVEVIVFQLDDGANTRELEWAKERWNESLVICK